GKSRRCEARRARSSVSLVARAQSTALDEPGPARVREPSEGGERALGPRAEEAPWISEHRPQLWDEARIVGRVFGDDRAHLVVPRAEAHDEDVVAFGAIELGQRAYEGHERRRRVVVFVG